MGHADPNAVVSLVAEESTELLAEEGTIIIQTAVEPAAQIGVSSKVSLKVVNPFPHKALTNVVVSAEGNRLTKRVSIGLGTIPAGGEAETEVTIMPRPRTQPLAMPQQNEYELALSLDCDEVKGISATQSFAPAPATEEGVPPADPAPEPAAIAFKHVKGYLAAGNNVHVATYSFEEAKVKFAALKAGAAADASGRMQAPLGFTFRHEEAEPAAGERMTVYFKHSDRAGKASAWHFYLEA